MRLTVSRYRSAALGSMVCAGTEVASFSPQSSSKSSDCFVAEFGSGPSPSILARFGGRSWFAVVSVSWLSTSTRFVDCSGMTEAAHNTCDVQVLEVAEEMAVTEQAAIPKADADIGAPTRDNSPKFQAPRNIDL